MKIIFLFLIACLDEKSRNLANNEISESSTSSLEEPSQKIQTQLGPIVANQPTQIQTQLGPIKGPIKENIFPQETPSLEVSLLKANKFSTASTAHVQVKTNEPLKDSFMILQSLATECLQKGCLMSIYGGSLIGPVGNKKYTYFLSITGPHGNIFTSVESPDLPYTLELTIPVQALESTSGLTNNLPIKIYVDYTQYNWQVRFE